MSANFFAILRDGDITTCRRIRVAKDAQKSLTEECERQAAEFLTYRHRESDADAKAAFVVEEAEHISFFPIYTIHDRSQVFEIEAYTLAPVILQAAQNPDSMGPLKLDDDSMPRIRAICATMSTRNPTRVLFQGFERRRLLAKDRWTFLQDPTVFSRVDRPGFTVGDSIHAIYDDRALLFRSFTVTSRFISLIDIFNEASDDKVQEVLQHRLLHVDDVPAVLQNADTVMRKQFAAVAELGVLDKVEPARFKETAREFDIEIALHGARGKAKTIVFPNTKKEQKELLTFLTEGYFKGPLTGTAYQSNSHRPKKRKSAKQP